MSSFSVQIRQPWVLLLLLPLVALALIPYLRLPRHRRRTRNRVVSLILHLLILALALPLLAGVSIHTERRLDTFDVVLVADLSASNEKAIEAMNARIQSILKEEEAAGFRIGIVTFGDNQVYAARLGTSADKLYMDYLDCLHKPDASGTDIAAALLCAKELLEETANSRLILLSDGLATDGEALPIVQAMAEEGVHIYAVHTEHESPESEVQLGLLELEGDVMLGESTPLAVNVWSTAPGVARLSLYDNSVLRSETTITLSGGEECFRLPYEPIEGGLHELCIRLESEADTIAENNQAYTYAFLDVSERLLIVDGTGFESSWLCEQVEKDYAVTVVSPALVPANLNDLRVYAEVVLMNVDANDLPAGYDRILNTYVHENGGGLFTVGGKNTYALGHMANTRFEDMLPIKITGEEEQVLELMLIMDISASMSHIPEGADRPKVDIAKEGAIECVKALKNADYVGIVTFDRDADVFQPITPATNRDSIIQRIRGIETGVGTYYSNALNIARTVLFNSNHNADQQHVIFLTDGAPSDYGYTEIIRSMASKGISVSAIAICEEGDSTAACVEEIARVGGGRSYVVTDVAMLPAIMREETKLSQRELINEKTVIPKYKDYSPVIVGIDRLPTLDGYIGVGAKSDAKVVYTVGSDPIYAEWSYGAGRVASFMSDLSGHWSADFLRSGNSKLFVRNIVRHLDANARDEDEENDATVGGRMNVEFEPHNHTTTVHVRTTPIVGHTMQARITAPDGTVQSLTLNAIGSSGYTGRFKTKAPGVYTVYLEEADENGKRVAGTEVFTTFSYSNEYDTFRDPLEGYMHLDALAAAGGGRILLPDEAVFCRETLVISRDYDPSLPVLVVVIILFLLDIAARKFNFKWPHELLRSYREQKKKP